MAVTRSLQLLVGAVRRAPYVVWLIVAAPVLVLVVTGFPHAYRDHPVLCTPANSSCEPIDAEERAKLDDVGVSPELLAAYDGVAIPAFTILAFVGPAAVIVRRRPRDVFAVFTATALLLFGAVALGGPTESLAASQPIMRLPVHLLELSGQVAFAALFYMFPDGRWTPRWTRWLLALVAALFAVDIFAPGTALDLFEGPGFLLALVTLVGAQVHRYRKVSDLVVRQQTKWVCFGFCASIGVFSVLLAVGFANRGLVESAVGLTVLRTGMYLTLAAVPLSIAMAILRHRLWDIDVVINRTLVWTALSAASIAMYLGVVTAGRAVAPSGQGTASVVAAAMIALTFAPLRSRIQLLTNRLVYGHRNDPQAIMSRLGERLEATLAPHAVAQTIVDTVRETLRLPYVALEASHMIGAPTQIASAGAPVADLIRIPLVYAGTPVGSLVASPRPGERELGSADLRVLYGLSHHAGLAVHAMRLLDEALSLSTDLRRSRQQLVTAREEERRRLRRDLHDGLGPQLASIALRAEIVRDMVPSDLPEAVELLDQIDVQAEHAVVEIRRLVDGLRPSALDDLTLLGAIRALATDLSSSKLSIAVQGPDPMPALPAAVEVATYRVVQEALHNAVRHSLGTKTRVNLRLVGSELELSVHDDGHGNVGERDGGLGLQSMRDRVTEIGGTFEIVAKHGCGTQVRARLPLGAQ